MKNKKNFLQEMLQSQSIFAKIFVILFVSILGMVAFIMLWVNNQARANNRNRTIEGNLSRLEAMDTGLVQSLESTSQMMVQMMWSKDFCDQIITGGTEDSARNYRIITQLDNCLRGENNYLKDVYFCSLTGRTIMRSGSYEILDLEDSSIYRIVEEAIEQGDVFFYGQERDEGAATYLIYQNGRLFLVQNFRLAMEPLGIAICEFDAEKLANAIADDISEPDSAVYLYDSRNHPILSSILDYSSMEAALEDTDVQITRENQNTVELRSGMVYYMSSADTGVRYLLRVAPGNIGVTFGETVKGSLPAILILMLIVLSVNIYVVRTLYLPITKLVDMVSDTDEEGSRRERGRAFEYLEGAYHEARNKEQEMKTTIDTLAPDLFEATMRKLLEGKKYRRSELLEILAGIHSSIPVDGRFVICTCMIEEPGNRQVSAREWALYTTSLQNLVQEMQEKQEKEALTYTIRMEQDQLVILMMFSQDSSAVRIKRECRELCQYLMKKAEPLPYTLRAESGQIYNCMTDIQESYLESIERIRYMKQHEDDTKENVKEVQSVFDPVIPDPADRKKPEQADAVTAAQNDRPYLKKNVAEMIRTSLKGTLDSAMVIHHRLCDETVNRYNDRNLRRSLYSSYLDEWAEQLSVYPISADELENLKNLGSPREIATIEDEETLLIRMEEKVRFSCQILVNYGKTNRYKYVDQAKTYMEANYDNSDLSLNPIAEHIGITASYLSELFAEVSGMKFSAALAELRVNHAREMLQTTDLSIREVGEACGFNSVQNFIRVFKKVSGYTPGQYRDMKNDSKE